MKRGFKFLIVLLLAWGVGIFCETQTQGFRFQEILSHMPNAERWETPKNDISPLLNQQFSFLGKGEQFYAFLGEDQKTVLKFFRHRKTFWGKEGDLSPLFDSAKLAFDALKEETGLIALQLNKNSNLPKVTIKDKLGILHTVDLCKTEFLLQARAELFCQALDEKMKHGDGEGAKRQIRSLMTSLYSQCQKGVHNSDTAFKRNFGAVGEQAICMDIGSFWKDDRLKARAAAEEEISRSTARLQRWLKKHYPELLNCYEDAKKAH